MARTKTTAAYDVIIVGGGIVGATLACALGDSGLKIALLERAASPTAPGKDSDGRVSAMTLASQQVFKHLGVWDAIAANDAAPVRSMQVWDRSGVIGFDAAEIGEPCLAYIIENRAIVHALADRLGGFANVHALYSVELDEIDLAGEARVKLADGRSLRATLLVGADGANSRVRAAAGITQHRLPFQQHSIVATVRTAQPHGQVARQRFLSTGPVALLPLADAHTSSLVWSVDDEQLAELMALDEAAFCQRLSSAFGDALGAITAASGRTAFPLTATHVSRYVDDHVALIGDAAHTVHPLAGQGANLGILDAAALAEVLRTAVAERRAIGAKRTLRRYERWRKEENLTMLATTGGLKLLFGSRLQPLIWSRNAGLSLTDRLGPVKRWIMNRASGIAGDLPPLARR